MIKLSHDDILKLAQLAKLSLTEKEAESYTSEISAILEYVELLMTVDIASLEPTNQVTGLVNVFRPDEVIDYGYKPKELLANVPDTQDGFIKVKRVIQ